ncbi:hypothetical protein LTR50_002102 [Elasticomyces elasticus]|nr:hypothetical protein LTR50_002102 [Elasticomyces elasticus]
MEVPNRAPWRPAANRDSQHDPRSMVPSKRRADTQEAAWVADEDRFVLQQAKKKAVLRIRGGRARPVDWLAVTLRAIDTTLDPLEDEADESELDIVDPEAVFEGLDSAQLAELEKDIDTYLALESNRSNLDFWNTMKLICKDRRQLSQSSTSSARGVNSISSDVDRLLAPKSCNELESLEKQIRRKLKSNEPIDVEYWEHLLKSLLVWKAKAKLRTVCQLVASARLNSLRKQQKKEAEAAHEWLQTMILGALGDSETEQTTIGSSNVQEKASTVLYKAALDPEPFLKLRAEDNVLESSTEDVFLDQIASERHRITKLGYVPANRLSTNASLTHPKHVSGRTVFAPPVRGSLRNDDLPSATSAAYEREVARGVNENEEIFAGEEDVETAKIHGWADKYRPRKPRYFNRVQMGYEWNKYNQTHYDHDNPPPKVVQGYKFNVFYPDLIDKTKAPTYRIERENGRKRGQSFAPAGEEDTCLIRFVAGPPYEDLAFRIVDKEWDYSAKRERGFRSSFDKGILQLHFQFKKIYYRK